MPQQTIALLDCNVVNYLVRPPQRLGLDGAAICARLTRAVRERRLLCFATEHLIAQIGGAALTDPPKMHAMFRLLHELSRGYVLVDRPSRIRAERVASRRLDVFDLCFEPRREAYFWSYLDSPIERDPAIRKAARRELARGRKDAEFFEGKVEPVRALAGGKGNATRNLDAYHRDSAPLVEDWVRDFLRDSSWTRSIARDGRPWPAPQELPSIWSYVSFFLSRLQLVNTRRLSADDGDHGDIGLYSESAYADVFVTDDGAMKRIIENIGPSATPVQTFPEFIAKWARS